MEGVFARLMAIFPLLWVEVLLCSVAHGAEVIDQIALLSAVSGDVVDARQRSKSDALRASSGDTLVLRLTDSGPYDITIDKTHQSSLGNTIIRGTTPSGGSSLMVIGSDGHVRGHFERPDEVVQVSSDEDGIVTAWVEGVDAEMLPLHDDAVIPQRDMDRDIAEPPIKELRDATTVKATELLNTNVSYARYKTGEATIRILIYYENTMQAISTVADYLVETTNTALAESGVSAALEITGLKPVALGPPPTVSSVLNWMKLGESPFDNIDQDLSTANADLAATLIGSYPENPQGGIAQVGGKFSTARLSVTRYHGYQEGNSLYPTTIFAHEIGHNLGAFHNRENYENNGAGVEDYTFSYAFGYLTEGVQRSVMSYPSAAYNNEREVNLFSNPDLTYDGYPMGVPASRDDSAFVAHVLENNRHVAASANEFAWEHISYSSFSRTIDSFEGEKVCRYMRITNRSDSDVRLASEVFLRPDGTISDDKGGSYSAPGFDFGYSYSNGFCYPPSEPPTYTESFFRLYHPITGELIEGPRFKWSETVTPQTELRIAYTDGGEPIGNTVRMIPVGEEEDIVFQPDRGFALDKIESTCEGNGISGGFRVRATIDPCLLEASFLDNRTAPSAPLISSTDYGDGEIILSVSVANDGGTDITGYTARCTDGTKTHIGTSTSSPITVSELTNDVAYTCRVTATNSVGTSSASAATDPITPEEQVGGGLPIWLLYLATQQANNVPVDTDNDGVEDRYDVCANTLPGESVDASGCSDSQI